ncbi:MAG: TlpA disulfide reductase family protein [Candidatus Promineifilaceae bacterium]|nr:TlpA disulfide reductase family protein [Candidatus Promineifilaceae bacterium]
MAIEGEEKGSQLPNRLNPFLLIAGLFVLGLALAMLLFGGRLFGAGSSFTGESEFEKIPALSGVNREGVPLPKSGAPLNVGDKAHDFSLPDPTGNQVSLSDFAGKPVIVNFWATWCPPCRLEMPELQRAFETHAADELVILAVNEAEQPEVVTDFFYDEMDFTYTPLIDEEAEVGTAYGAVGLPVTFFVDPKGDVQAVHRGGLTATQIEDYLTEIIP